MSRYLPIALLLCSVVPTVFAAESTIEGTFTIGGKDIALTHVLVLDFDDAEGLGDGPELRILFSESEISLEELEVPVLFNLDALAREGKLRGVLLRFDPTAETREVHGTAYLTPDNPQTSMPFFTLGGSSGGVDSLKVEDGKLSGHIEQSAAGDADFGLPDYAFAISFSAPIEKGTPVTVLKGKEAMESAQMKTLIQFEEALRKADLDTVRKMTTELKVRQMDDFIAQVGKEKFLEMVQQMVPDPTTHEKSLVGIYLRGERTTIVLNDQGGKTSMTLSKKGDGWIVN